MSSRLSSKVIDDDNVVWEAKQMGGHAVQSSLLSCTGMNGQYVVYAITPCTIAIITWPLTIKCKDSEPYSSNTNSTVTNLIRVPSAFAQMKLCSLPEPEEDEIAFVKAHASKDWLCVGTTRRGLYLTRLSSPQLTSSTRLPLSVTGELTYDACFITIRRGDKNNINKKVYRNEEEEDDDVLIFSSAMKGRAGMITSRLTLWNVQCKNVMWRGPMEAVIGLASLPHCLQFAAWTSTQVFICTIHVTSTTSLSSSLTNINNSNNSAMSNKMRLRVTICKCNTVEELSGVQYVQCAISEMSSYLLHHSSSELVERPKSSEEMEKTTKVGLAPNESSVPDEDKTAVSKNSSSINNTLLALTTNGILIAFDMSCGLVYRWMNCRVRPANSLYLTRELIVIAGAMLRFFTREEWGVCGKLKVENTTKLNSSSYSTKFTSLAYTSALCPLRDSIVLFTNNGEITVYEMQHKAALHSNTNDTKATATLSTEQPQADDKNNVKNQNDSAVSQRVTTIVSAKEKFIGLHKCYHYTPQFYNIHSNTMFVLPSRSSDMYSVNADEQANQRLLEESAMEPSNEEINRNSNNGVTDKENNLVDNNNNLCSKNSLNSLSWALWCPSSFTLFNEAIESCKVNEMESNCALYHSETRSFITFTPTTRELVAYSIEDAWREWARLEVNAEIIQLCCAYSGDRLAALDSQRHVHTFTCYWKYVEATHNESDDHVWNTTSVNNNTSNEEKTIHNIEENSNNSATNTSVISNSANSLEPDELDAHQVTSHFVTKSLILAPADNVNYSHLGNIECIFFVGNTLFGITDRSLLDLDEHTVKLRELSRHAPLAACGAGRYLAVILYRNNCLSYHVESGVLDRVSLPHNEATKLCFDAHSNLLAISSTWTIALYSVTDKITLTSIIRHDWLRSTPENSSSSLFISSLSHAHQSLSKKQKSSEQSNSNKCSENGSCIVSVGILTTTTTTSMAENYGSVALLYVLDLRGSITVYAQSSKNSEPQTVTRGSAHVLQSPEPEYSPHNTLRHKNKEEEQLEERHETNELQHKMPLSISSSSFSTLTKRQVVLPLSLKNTKNSILSNRFRLDSPPSASSLPSGDLVSHKTSTVEVSTATTTHENSEKNDANQREEGDYLKNDEENNEESNAQERRSTPHYRSNSRPHRLSGRRCSHHKRTYSEDVPSCRELSEQLDALSLYAEQSEMQSRSMRNRSSSHSNSSFCKHHNNHQRELRRTSSGHFSEPQRGSENEHEHEHEREMTSEWSDNPVSSTLISASEQSVQQLVQVTPREQVELEQLKEYEQSKSKDRAVCTPTHAQQSINSSYNSPGQPRALESAPEPTPFDVTQLTQETSQSEKNNVKYYDPYAKAQTTHVDNNDEYKSSLKKLQPANILSSSSEFINNAQISKKFDGNNERNSNIVSESNEEMYHGHHVLDSMVDIQVSALTSVSLSSNITNNINNSTAIHLTGATRSSSTSVEHPSTELEKEPEEWNESTPPLLPLAPPPPPPPLPPITKETKIEMQPEQCERSPARKGDPLLEMEAITHTFDEDNVNYASLALTHINPEQHIHELTREQTHFTQQMPHEFDKAETVEKFTENVNRYGEQNRLHTSQTASVYSPSSSSSTSPSSSALLSSSSSTSASFSPHFINTTRLLRKSLEDWTHLLTSEVHSMSASRCSNSEDTTTITGTANDNTGATNSTNSHAHIEKKMPIQEQDKELAELSVLLSNALLSLQSHSPSPSVRSASHTSALLDNYDTSTVASFATNATDNSSGTAADNNNTTTTTIQTAALQSIISELSHIQEQNSRLESQNAYILRKLGEKQK